jgi:hypothetical protein
MYFRFKSDCQKAKVAVYRLAGHPDDPTVMKCTDTCLKRLKNPPRSLYEDDGCLGMD